mgnify:FL=1
MVIKKFDLNKLSKQLKEAWKPKNVETIDDFVIRAAKFDGVYHWHKHENEDELFIVFEGKIKIQTRKSNIILKRGEGVKIPKGIDHCPVSLEPSIILMFEPVKLKSKGN